MPSGHESPKFARGQHVRMKRGGSRDYVVTAIQPREGTWFYQLVQVDSAKHYFTRTAWERDLAPSWPVDLTAA